MPKFSVSVDHQVGREQAVEKLKTSFDQAKTQAGDQVDGLEEVWDDDGNLDFSFSAMGFKISGRMVTGSDQVEVNGNLPFAALPFRGALENQIAGKIRDAIA